MTACRECSAVKRVMATGGYDYFGVTEGEEGGALVVANPSASAPRTTLKGTFRSTRAGVMVRGSLVITMHHALDMPVLDPYNTRAWITFTGPFRNGKTKRLKLVIGTLEGVTCAVDSTGRFKMFITRASATRRGGWRLKGNYERVEPDDQGRFSLREVFEDDDFSTEDEEDRTSGHGMIGLGSECSVM